MNAIEKYHKINSQLMSVWKTESNSDSPFISDGVMDPDTWFSKEIRPLFLLKEAYGGTSDWDLVKDHVMQLDTDGSSRKLCPMWKKYLCGLNGF